MNEPHHPYRNLEFLGSKLAKSPHLKPGALAKRLNQIEGWFLEALRSAGCWDDALSDLNIDRYFIEAEKADNLEHLKQAAASERFKHAASGLFFIRKLRRLLEKTPNAASVATCAMIVESSVALIRTRVASAIALGSRREQSHVERTRDELSSLLYLLVKAAHADNHFGRCSLVTAYEQAAKDGVDPSKPKKEQLIYIPATAGGLHEQSRRWRKLGLFDVPPKKATDSKNATSSGTPADR